jgi:hypothetical protein
MAGMLASKKRSLVFGGNGEESLAEVPQSGTKAGLKECFGEVSLLYLGSPVIHHGEASPLKKTFLFRF